MITTVDVETSYQKTETGGYDPSPFHPNEPDHPESAVQV